MRRQVGQHQLVDIKCEQCGLVIKLSQVMAKVVCSCGAIITTDTPKPSGTVKRFAKAVVKHAANGFKQTDPEVLEIRKAECAKCEHNNGKTCNKCGCQIVGWPNKLAWATEKCPVGKW